MKLALFSTWKDKCGIAENSEMLVSELLKKGIEVEVFAEGKDWSRTKSFDGVTKKIKNSGADVVHLNYEMYLCGFGGDSRFSSMLKQIKIPKIVEIHTWIRDSPPKDFEADAFLTRGTKMTEAAEAVFGNKRVHKTTFGTEVFEDVDALNMTYSPRNYIKLATHGFLGADKGIDGLVDAFIKLNKMNIPTQLKFVGGLQPNSPHKEYMMKIMRRVIKEGFANRLFLTAFLPTTKEIQEAAVDSDVLVFNYNDMMTQGVFVSSASIFRVLPTGVPIIGTKENRLTDLIDRKCVVEIPQNDSDALVKAALDLKNDGPLSDAYGGTARGYSREITWDKIADNTIKIYEKVM